MTRLSAISFLTYFLAAAVAAELVAPVLASEPKKVSMTLQSVALTNDSLYSIVFLVTNAGTKPARLYSCGCSFFPTNFHMPLSMFGSCTVPSGTNCTVRVTWRLSQPGSYWFRYAVFEPASAFQKTKLAALRLRARVSGKARYSDIWISDLWSPAYEITSPLVPELPEPPPTLVARTKTPIPWSLDFDCLADPIQQDGAVKGSNQSLGSETNSPPSVPAFPWLFRRGRSDMRDRTPPIPLATPDKPLAVLLSLKVKFAA